MNERNRNYPEWDDNTYYTGPTEPPKNRGALVALLLIFIIFLCGIVTVLGVLNIRLFQKLNREEPSQELAISFTTEETTSETQAPEATGEDREAKPAVHAGCTMDLQAAPQGGGHHSRGRRPVPARDLRQKHPLGGVHFLRGQPEHFLRHRRGDLVRRISRD